jgi:DNA-binding NarL/FixJ family response regulator
LLAALTEARLAAGDLSGARASGDELHVMADESGATPLEALAATARGAVALAEGDTRAALDRLRRARALWLDLGMPFEAAQARVLLARACRATGDHDTADMELGAARSAYERLGSWSGVASVDRLLGARPELPGGLTPRQGEVLRLVAVGMSNRAIAAELVISEHTVSRHLENIYARLEVSSRAAAAAFAHSHDLV